MGLELHLEKPCAHSLDNPPSLLTDQYYTGLGPFLPGESRIGLLFWVNDSDLRNIFIV